MNCNAFSFMRVVYGDGDGGSCSFDGTDDEDDHDNDEVQHDVKDDPIVDSRRCLEQHNIMRQYHRQHAQLRTRPTKASAGGGAEPTTTAKPRGGWGRDAKGTTTGPTPQSRRGYHGGGGGVWQPCIMYGHNSSASACIISC